MYMYHNSHNISNDGMKNYAGLVRVTVDSVTHPCPPIWGVNTLYMYTNYSEQKGIWVIATVKSSNAKSPKSM